MQPQVEELPPQIETLLELYIEGRAPCASGTSVRGFLKYQRVPDQVPAGSWHHTFFLIVQTAAERLRFKARVPRGFQRVPAMLEFAPSQ